MKWVLLNRFAHRQRSKLKAGIQEDPEQHADRPGLLRASASGPGMPSIEDLGYRLYAIMPIEMSSEACGPFPHLLARIGGKGLVTKEGQGPFTP